MGIFSTRTLIGILTAIGIAIAFIASDLAAGFIVIVGAAIVYLLHTIEFKINKLLDERGVTVWDSDIAKD